MGPGEVGGEKGKARAYCVCNANDEVECEINLPLKILIDVRKIEILATHTVAARGGSIEYWRYMWKAWVYGHEQRHVWSKIHFARTLQKQAAAAPSKTCLPCETDRQNAERFLNKALKDYGDLEHFHRTFPIGPESGEPYVPLNLPPAGNPEVGPEPEYVPPDPRTTPDPPLTQKPWPNPLKEPWP
jgi:hypothetical protein